jgi:2-iminobutanoate/2-iminopropanoate deaminase
MSRVIIRVEPLSTFIERFKAPISIVTRHGDTLYLSGLPPFDAATGEVFDGPIEQQMEIVMEQLKLCLAAAGSSLEQVLRCTLYCTSSAHYATVNAIYARYFPVDPPARTFVNVAGWPGKFDVEVECVAAV